MTTFDSTQQPFPKAKYPGRKFATKQQKTMKTSKKKSRGGNVAKSNVPVPEAEMDGQYQANVNCHIATKVPQRVYDDRENGEFRAIVLGTTVWILVPSVAKAVGLKQKDVIRLAGPKGVVSISNADLDNVSTSVGFEFYVRQDIAMTILKASCAKEVDVSSLKKWIQKDLLNPSNLLKSGGSVSTRILHKMFAPHMDFFTWVEEFAFKNFGLPVPYYLVDFDYDRETDFPIPLTLACDIALQQYNFIGTVVYLLITDGGSFHGGILGEPADVSLKRFLGLIPDRWGRVNARKLHEFLRDDSSFDTWLSKSHFGGEWRARHPGALPPEAGESFVCVFEAYCWIKWDAWYFSRPACQKIDAPFATLYNPLFR